MFSVVSLLFYLNSHTQFVSYFWEKNTEIEQEHYRIIEKKDKPDHLSENLREIVDCRQEAIEDADFEGAAAVNSYIKQLRQEEKAQKIH